MTFNTLGKLLQIRYFREDLALTGIKRETPIKFSSVFEQRKQKQSENLETPVPK